MCYVGHLDVPAAPPVLCHSPQETDGDRDLHAESYWVVLFESIPGRG